MENPSLASGSLFGGRFEIDRLAGSGGMGTVYRARDRYTGEIVALKLLHTGFGAAAESERFEREAQILATLATLGHPNIVAHVAHGQDLQGQKFLAMEWLDGEDLGSRLLRGPLPLADTLTLLRQVAAALSAAHQRGIIHRDIKPTNLFLVGGEVNKLKLLDFGVARPGTTAHALTQTGVVVGTPAYMSPEQARGTRDLTPAADMFALGCVLYECLVGQPPFVAEHIAAVLVRILFEEPPPVQQRRPGLPADVVRLLARLLSKDAALRPADATALQREIDNLGELASPGLAVTVAGPGLVQGAFAEEEQSLFSVVLASPPEAPGALDAVPSAVSLLLGEKARKELKEELSRLKVSLDFLATGALVVTVHSLGSAHDQVAVAARAARIIKTRWPQATVSLATGRGAIRGLIPVGEVAEQAARVVQSWRPASADERRSGVFMDSLSAKLLDGRFVQTPQPGGALLLGEEDADASRPLLGRPTPCVGRQMELAMLEAQLTGCTQESESRVVLVTAPPGVGKSRMRHEFMRQLGTWSEPLTVLLGRGDLMSAGSPYGILIAAVRRLCALDDGEPIEQQRLRLRARLTQYVPERDQERIVTFLGELCNVPFPEQGNPMLQAARQDPKIMADGLRRAVLDWLRAECQAAPVVLVLDDLQWGDSLTVSLLNEALRELRNEALLLLAFARLEVHQTFPKLWHEHKLQEIQLKGLSKRACERLIQEVLGKQISEEATARMIAQSRGNALFLEELIRAMKEGTSEEPLDTVVAMLQARIGRLDSGPGRAVRAASLLGQTFWQGCVATVLGLPENDPQVESWLTVLIDAELILREPSSRFPDQKEYVFRHALVREAAYSLLTASDLSTGHRLVGRFLERAGERDDAVLAEHFERGGEKPRAAAFYSRAAEYSLERGDNLGVLQKVERGLGNEPDREVLGTLRSIEAAASLWLNQAGRVIDSSEVALSVLRPGSLGWCRAVMGAVLAASEPQHSSRKAALVGLFLTTEPDANAQAVYIETLYTVIGGVTHAAPAPVLDAFLRRLAACIAVAEHTAPAIRRYFLSAHAWSLVFRRPQPWTAIRECEQTIELAREAGDKRVELSIRSCSIEWTWAELGDQEGARQRLGALAETFAKNQLVLLESFWRLGLALLLCDAADADSWDRAEQLIAPIAAKTDGFFLFSAIANGLQARVALRRGQPESAERLARAALQRLPEMPLWATLTATVQARALMALGRPGEAAALVEQVLGMIPLFGGAGFTEVELRLAASEAFHAAGHSEQARAQLRETLRQIQLRADDITDPRWKDSYLTCNPHCVRAQQLALEWGT